ncbi:MAG: hypothetical protein ABWW69_06455 [Pyrodictiaceae archaeon]
MYAKASIIEVRDRKKLGLSTTRFPSRFVKTIDIFMKTTTTSSSE